LPRRAIDNNLAERTLRQVAVGREFDGVIRDLFDLVEAIRGRRTTASPPCRAEAEDGEPPTD
jgi:hypothetical protein